MSDDILEVAFCAEMDFDLSGLPHHYKYVRIDVRKKASTDDLSLVAQVNIEYP